LEDNTSTMNRLNKSSLLFIIVMDEFTKEMKMEYHGN